MSQYKELKPRNAAPWAILLAFSAACGDPQLDIWQGSEESLFVVPADWSTLYAPRLDAVTPFPFLADIEQPRLESTNPDVAEVEFYVSQIYEPRFRAAWIRTRGVGDADIQLWDGQELVHTESIRVREPAALELDLQPPGTLPSWANDSETSLQLLPLAQGEAILRFYDELGEEMVGAGRVDEADGVAPLFMFPSEETPNSLYDPNRVLLLSRVEGQVDFHDRVGILGSETGATLGLSLPDVDFPPRQLRGLLDFAYPELVGEIEVLVNWESVSVSVVVYGRSGDNLDTRVMGLHPVATLDGDVDRIHHDPKFPWMFSIDVGPGETELGTLEIRWRDFVETIQLNGGE